MCDQQRLRPDCAYAKSGLSLCWWLEYTMTVMLLTKHHLDFQRIRGVCTGLSESIHVKMPYWKTHIAAHIECCIWHCYWESKPSADISKLNRPCIVRYYYDYIIGIKLSIYSNCWFKCFLYAYAFILLWLYYHFYPSFLRASTCWM